MAFRWYRACYALLLRLYPRPFRERFGPEMARTFHDLCRERRNAGGPLPELVLWIFFETLAGIMKERIRMTALSQTVLRVALGALALLMVPLVASRLVDGWNWDVRAFVFVYFLFFATGMAFALIASKMGAWSYKAGVGLALVTGFALGWTNMVFMSEAENPAYVVYFGVLVMGGVSAWIARLEASGLARALFAMAVVLALMAVGQLMLTVSPTPPDRAQTVFRVVFAVLFATSGFLFRHASLPGTRQDSKSA